MKSGRIKQVFFVNLKLCLLEIFTNRTRSFITTLGLFLAVTALLVNLAFIRGMDDDLKRSMEMIGGLNIITVQKVDPVTKKEKINFQKSSGLSIAEAEKIAEELPEIRSVLPSKSLGWNRFRAEGRRTWGKLIAVTPEYLNAYNYKFDIGRMISNEDMVKYKHVCMIGKQLAERLFIDPVSSIGKTIVIRNIPLKIIGIIWTKDKRNHRARECIMPYSTFAMRFSNAKTNLDQVSFLLTDSKNARNVQKKMEQLYRAYHRGAEDFTVEANIDKIKEMELASMGIKIIFWSIAIISIIVGGISIMNIMFATIGDRIREIGIHKAIGAKRYDIFIKFIIEAIVVCFVGGLPGIMLGASVTLIPEGVFPYYPRLVAGDYILAVVFVSVTGMLSGFFPALRAAYMQPVEALRY